MANLGATLEERIETYEDLAGVLLALGGEVNDCVCTSDLCEAVEWLPDFRFGVSCFACTALDPEYPCIAESVDSGTEAK